MATPGTAVGADEARRLMQDIADHPEAHKLPIGNLVKQYRRLGKWIKVNAEHLGAHVGVSAAYTMGVVARVLELTGHRLGPITDEEITATGAQVMEVVPSLLPLDDGLRARLAAVPWLAQPGILDVLIEDVFEQGGEPAEGRKPPEVLFQVFVLVWVAVEALAMAADPPEPRP